MLQESHLRRKCRFILQVWCSYSSNPVVARLRGLRCGSGSSSGAGSGSGAGSDSVVVTNTNGNSDGDDNNDDEYYDDNNTTISSIDNTPHHNNAHTSSSYHTPLQLYYHHYQSKLDYHLTRRVFIYWKRYTSSCVLPLLQYNKLILKAHHHYYSRFLKEWFLIAFTQRQTSSRQIYTIRKNNTHNILSRCFGGWQSLSRVQIWSDRYKMRSGVIVLCSVVVRCRLLYSMYKNSDVFYRRYRMHQAVMKLHDNKIYYR